MIKYLFRFLLFVIKVYWNYPLVVPLKVKKNLKLKSLSKKLDKSHCKPDKRLNKAANLILDKWNHGSRIII